VITLSRRHAVGYVIARVDHLSAFHPHAAIRAIDPAR
jgi:hypothetical protein